MRSAPLLALLVLGCTVQDPAGLTCPDGACPPGLECIAGQCVAPNEADLSMPGEDLGVADQSSLLVDASADAAASPTRVAGCSGLGYKIGSAYACVGAFVAAPGSPTASSLCASGFAVLTDSSKVDQTACRLLPGFFAANALMTRYNVEPVSAAVCDGMPDVGKTRLFAGCGAARGTVANLSTACHGYTQAIDVGPDASWTCSTGTTVDGCSQTSMVDGAICG